jgi:type I restriction enzyme M protein
MQQEAIRKLLSTLLETLFKDRDEFEAVFDDTTKKTDAKAPSTVKKAILSALSERDETAAICRDKDGNPEPDPELRDTESVPIPPEPDPVDNTGVPQSVRQFFDREVKPHVTDAWIDVNRRELRDGRVGLVGYEINFNGYFYRYTPPRPLDEIEADIRAVEQDILKMLAEVTNQG